jgi:hypothetical protein
VGEAADLVDDRGDALDALERLVDQIAAVTETAWASSLR